MKRRKSTTSKRNRTRKKRVSKNRKRRTRRGVGGEGRLRFASKTMNISRQRKKKMQEKVKKSNE